jgi:hypothetical protein
MEEGPPTEEQKTRFYTWLYELAMREPKPPEEKEMDLLARAVEEERDSERRNECYKNMTQEEKKKVLERHLFVIKQLEEWNERDKEREKKGIKNPFFKYSILS